MEACVGQIVLFASNYAPENWALSDGKLMSIEKNTLLFSILRPT